MVKERKRQAKRTAADEKANFDDAERVGQIASDWLNVKRQQDAYKRWTESGEPSQPIAEHLPTVLGAESTDTLDALLVKVALNLGHSVRRAAAMAHAAHVLRHPEPKKKERDRAKEILAAPSAKGDAGWYKLARKVAPDVVRAVAAEIEHVEDLARDLVGGDRAGAKAMAERKTAPLRALLAKLDPRR
jgi:hypothetical protein